MFKQAEEKTYLVDDYKFLVLVKLKIVLTK